MAKTNQSTAFEWEGQKGWVETITVRDARIIRTDLPRKNEGVSEEMKQVAVVPENRDVAPVDMKFDAVLPSEYITLLASELVRELVSALRISRECSVCGKE